MIEYELEDLNWKKRQLALRKKYADTPPGLTGKMAEEEEQCLMAVWKEYEDHRRFCLAGNVTIPAEPFAGRQMELKEIRSMFSQGIKTVFLSGMGGIGKSALARTYGRLYAEEYDQILIWGYDKSLEQIFADDGQLGITNMLYTQSKYVSRRKYAREKYGKLAQIAKEKRILILLDNYNQTEDIWFEDLKRLNCDLLITTRLNSARFSEWGSVISVGALTLEEDWQEFYRLYGGNALTEQEWENIAQYRELIKGHTLKMKLVLSNPQQKWTAEQLAKSLLSNFRLKKTQIQVLCELSFFTVRGIPEEVYLSCTEESAEDVAKLKEYSLLEERREPSGQVFLSLHPVIAEAVCTTWQPSLTRCLKFVEKFSFYARFSWYRPREVDFWLMPQVLALQERIPKPVAWRYYLYECLATFYMVWECYDEAEQIINPLYDCVHEYYGEEHEFTAYMAFRRASLCHNAMRFESRFWYEECVRLYRGAKPTTHSFYHDKGKALSRLARSYEYDENYETAYVLLEEAMEAMEAFRRETEYVDPELWKLRRNCFPYIYLRRATLHFKQGDLELAQQDLDTGLSMFPLGEFQEVEIRRLQVRIYLAQGEYEKARDAAEQDLKLCIQYQGESYKMSLTCREVLGDIYRAMGEIQAANNAYLRVLILLQEKYSNQSQWMERLREKLEGTFE